MNLKKSMDIALLKVDILIEFGIRVNYKKILRLIGNWL